MAKLCDYFHSAAPEPWQVLGVNLRPFSLGHYIKLRRLESPFVSDTDASAGLGDLVLGVVVCSMSSHPDPQIDEFWTWLARPSRFNLWATLFGKTPMTPAEREVYKFGKRVGQFDVSEKIQLFAQYIQAHSTEPGYWMLKEENGGEPHGSHWSHAVVSALVSECGYTQLDALNVPMPLAFQDFYRRLEMNGVVRLMTPEEVKAYA